MVGNAVIVWNPRAGCFTHALSAQGVFLIEVDQVIVI